MSNPCVSFDEALPFKRFVPNAAFYYTMAVAFFLYESFKEDVTEPVVRITSYATTLRRKAIDFATKIVHTGGRTIPKVTRVSNSLQGLSRSLALLAALMT